MDKRTHPETGWVNVYSVGRFAGFRSVLEPFPVCTMQSIDISTERHCKNTTSFLNYGQNMQKNIDMTEQTPTTVHRKKELDDDIYSRILTAQRQLNADSRAGKRYQCRFIKLDPTL